MLRRSYRRLTPFLLLTTGCYTLQPVPGTVLTAGMPVGFDVTDVGRVALGGAMGPSILHIEGTLLRRTPDSNYVVGVSSVTYLGGGTQAWSGEPVTLKREYIGVTYQRRLSKSRTIAAAAVGVGAVAFILTRSLNGSGSPANPPPGPPDSTGNTYRGPRP
jgi:hypothetical protein